MAPAPQTQTVVAGATISFQGIYTLTLGSFDAGGWSGNDYIYNWLAFSPTITGTLTAVTSQLFSCANGSCTGPAYYVVCAVNAGTGGCPTGSVLATSDPTYGYSVVPNFTTQQFTFSGSNQITLTAGQTYYVEPNICCANGGQPLGGGIQTFLGTPTATTVGTIQVTTNLASATFSINGPAAYSGSGTSQTFYNAPLGTYSITFGEVPGYTMPTWPTQTAVAGGIITFTGTYNTNASRISLTSITGWTFGNLVDNAQWTGQPPAAPSTENIYDLFYAIDACQASIPCPAICESATEDGCTIGTGGQQFVAVTKPHWRLNGSGFCPPAGCAGTKGTVVFSDTAINAVSASNITNWNDDGTEITFTPSFVTSPFQYNPPEPCVTLSCGVDPNVSVTITTPDGLVATLPLPTPDGSPATLGAIATIDGRGYGQCTWYVANQRLAQGLPIPVPAYYTLGAVDENYVPQQWDVIDFTTLHTAIIISPVTPNRVNHPNGSATITYTFTVGEMNVGVCSATAAAELSCQTPLPGQCVACPWSELPSTISTKFVIDLSSTGVQSVQTRLYSLDTGHSCTGPSWEPYGCHATAYFRGGATPSTWLAGTDH